MSIKKKHQQDLCGTKNPQWQTWNRLFQTQCFVRFFSANFFTCSEIYIITQIAFYNSPSILWNFLKKGQNIHFPRGFWENHPKITLIMRDFMDFINTSSTRSYWYRKSSCTITPWVVSRSCWSYRKLCWLSKWSWTFKCSSVPSRQTWGSLQYIRQEIRQVSLTLVKGMYKRAYQLRHLSTSISPASGCSEGSMMVKSATKDTWWCVALIHANSDVTGLAQILMVWKSVPVSAHVLATADYNKELNIFLEKLKPNKSPDMTKTVLTGMPHSPGKKKVKGPPKCDQNQP